MNTKTLDDFIKELQSLAKEHGGDLEVMTAEGEEPFAEVTEDDGDPAVVIG